MGRLTKILIKKKHLLPQRVVLRGQMTDYRLKEGKVVLYIQIGSKRVFAT